MLNNTRPFFVIGIYLPPKTKAADVNECMQLISQAVLRIKTEAKNPYIVIGGDLNHADMDDAIGDYPDISISDSGPTRRGAYLDKMASNLGEEILEVRNNPPLHTEDGQQSDHRFVTYNCRLRHCHNFTWITYSYRKINDDGVKKYDDLISGIKWEESIPKDADVDTRTKIMHDKLMEIVNESFPQITNKVRSTDDPWIDAPTRKALKRRRSVFYNQLRSEKWRRMKETTNDMISRRKGAQRLINLEIPVLVRSLKSSNVELG